MVGPWVAGQSYPVLAGTPAIRWGRRALLATAIVPVLIVMLGIGMALSGEGYGESGFLVIVMAVLVVDVVLMCVFYALSAIKERAERKSGYSTVRDRSNLCEVDVESGFIIRLAGEPPLRLDERARRKEEISRVVGKGPPA
jgi:hypothetical protein